MRFNETLQNIWIPLLVGLLVGALLGWLLLGSAMSSVDAEQGAPHNLPGRHLDTFVTGLVPQAEIVQSSDEDSERSEAFNEIAKALCYPVEDYAAVKARSDVLGNESSGESDPFTSQLYEYVLDTFESATTCEKYLVLPGNEPVVSRGSGLRRWIPLLLFIPAILLVGVLLLNSQGVSLSNLNRPSTTQRQRRPRFRLDREDWDRGERVDIPRNPRRRETDEVDMPSRGRQSRASISEPDIELTPPAPEPELRSSRSYKYEPEDELEPERGTVIEEPIFDDDAAGFTAIYSRGDEAFERVFEIYGTNNQYLGDCSIEIADSLGSDPADVTAFKLRLFEAGSPRSVTKLLMSEYVFNNSALKARLATQGYAVLAQMGEPITLEGKTITVDTYLTNLLYSNDNGTPVRSVFDRVTVKLKAFVNQADDADDGSNILEF